MNAKKYFKCNEIIYGNEEDKINFIQTSLDYDKNKGGYIVRAIPIAFDGTFCKYVIDKDYFNYNIDYKVVIVPCNRRGKKAEEKAKDLFEETAMEHAETYLDAINIKNNRKIKIVEELA